jgi:saccharopine dehydrogenase-like NADP-dependent oxidoreductase
MGLDPGIDHMTASLIFDGIRKVASDIISFKSYCGGLIAPISDNNPWHYKFSWNPKNIINAGKDGAHYLKNGNPVHLPYESLFAQNETIQCEGIGALAYYANRDSLSYIELYGLQEASDFMRATLRYPSFCNGWDALIKMGLTNTTDLIQSDSGSLAEATKLIVQYDDTSLSLENFVWKKYGIVSDEVKKMIQWLGLFAEKHQKIASKTPGDILLNILEDKWKMQPEDKDMVVMQHEVIYKHKEVKNKLISSMVVIGDDAEFSAMAKTVGMPIAILAELIVNKKIKAPKGVVIPTMAEVYRPVLGRLEKMGMDFNDQMITDL